MNETLPNVQTEETFPDFLTHKQLCSYLQIGNNTAYSLAARKDFPKVPFGSRYRFPRDLVKAWMERQAQLSALPKSLRAMSK